MARKREPARRVLECTSTAVKLTPKERGQLVNRAKEAGAREGCSIPLVWIFAIGGGLLCIVTYLLQTFQFGFETTVEHCREWIDLTYPCRKPMIIGA